MIGALRFRTVSLYGAAALLLSIPVVHSIQPARAGVNDAACSGTSQVTYSPGLTETERPTTISGDYAYTGCSSPDKTLTSGKGHFEYQHVRSYHTNVSGAPGRVVITWSNSKTSTFDYTKSVTESNGAATVHLQGTITAGEFAGDNAVQDVTEPDRDPRNCTTSAGETATSGTLKLQISKP